MSQPGPDERLRWYIEPVYAMPDACRALLAALDRKRIQGGGELALRLEVDGIGRIRRVKVEEREYRLRA